MKTPGRTALLTASDLSLAGGCAAILSVLDIQLRSATVPEQVDFVKIKDWPPCFSFSALLSLATPGDIPTIT